MIKLALLGKDIKHSRSQEMYEKLLGEKIEYSLLDFESSSHIPELSLILKNNLNGLSITSPYKKHFVNEVEIEDRHIKELGVINSIKKISEKVFKATNTDYTASKVLLNKYLKEHKHACILGNGAMAQMIKTILLEEGMTFHQYSRSIDQDISCLDLAYQTENGLLINCCSRDFIFKGKLGQNATFWDMNYDFLPHQNLWSKITNYIDGLELLRLQAIHAANFFEINDRP